MAQWEQTHYWKWKTSVDFHVGFWAFKNKKRGRAARNACPQWTRVRVGIAHHQ